MVLLEIISMLGEKCLLCKCLFPGFFLNILFFEDVFNTSKHYLMKSHYTINSKIKDLASGVILAIKQRQSEMTAKQKCFNFANKKTL